jgi:hypothetical protein
MRSREHKKESGYALLSLLVAMTIGLVILASMAAKPSAQFVGQREGEEEMFFRAQQVSYAIQTYAMLKGGVTPQNLPTKLEDLLNEFNVQGREFHIVRKSALVDPMTGTEWKPIRLGDPKVKEFARTYMRVMAERQAMAIAAGGANAAAVAQQGQQGMPPMLMIAAQASGVSLTNLNASEDEEEEKKNTGATGFSLDLDSDSRPIVGVMSAFKKPLIRDYYGIESYDKALFFAGVQVPGINNIIPLGGGMGAQGGLPLPPGQGDTDKRPPVSSKPGGFSRSNNPPPTPQ